MRPVALNELLQYPFGLLRMPQGPAVLDDVAAEGVFLIAHAMPAGDIGGDAQGVQAKLFAKGILTSRLMLEPLHVVQGGMGERKGLSVDGDVSEIVSVAIRRLIWSRCYSVLHWSFRLLLLFGCFRRIEVIVDFIIEVEGILPVLAGVFLPDFLVAVHQPFVFQHEPLPLGLGPVALRLLRLLLYRLIVVVHLPILRATASRRGIKKPGDDLLSQSLAG